VYPEAYPKPAEGLRRGRLPDPGLATRASARRSRVPLATRPMLMTRDGLRCLKADLHREPLRGQGEGMWGTERSLPQASRGGIARQAACPAGAPNAAPHYMLRYAYAVISIDDGRASWTRAVVVIPPEAFSITLTRLGRAGWAHVMGQGAEAWKRVQTWVVEAGQEELHTSHFPSRICLQPFHRTLAQPSVSTG
jgi:hypothetical protein